MGWATDSCRLPKQAVIFHRGRRDSPRRFLRCPITGIRYINRARIDGLDLIEQRGAAATSVASAATTTALAAFGAQPADAAQAGVAGATVRLAWVIGLKLNVAFREVANTSV